jgi:hypothetical protein
MYELLMIVQLTPSDIAGPPALGESLYVEPAPPIPAIYPLLVSVTPFGKLPLIVSAGVPVDVE